MKHRVIALLALFVLMPFQNLSAWNKNNQEKPDSTLANQFNKKAIEAMHIIDTAEFYAQKALNLSLKLKFDKGIANAYNTMGIIAWKKNQYEKSISYYTKSLDIYRKTTLLQETSNTYGNIGLTYLHTGDFEAAIEHYKKSIEIRKQIDDKEGIANHYINIGAAYYYLGKYDKAVESFLNSVSFYEKINNKKGIADVYNNIGSLHIEQNNYARAIEYLNKSIAIDLELNDSASVAETYINIANLYLKTEKYQQALTLFQKSLNIELNKKNQRNTAYIYNNLGEVYSKLNNYDEALQCFLKAYHLNKEMSNKHNIAKNLINISRLNLLLANATSNPELKKSQFINAISYAQEALQIENSSNSIVTKNEAFKNLHEAYAGVFDFRNAYKYQQHYIETKDSLFNETKNKQIEELEGKYQNEKKEQEIKNQKLELAQKEGELKRKNAQRNASVLIALLSLGMIVFLIASIRQKKKTNQFVTEKNAELEQANEEIRAQRDEISQQRDIVTQQNEKIEQFPKSITDSISYAKQIQEALLPDQSLLRNYFTAHFVFYKPLSIVSGDFYWTTRLNIDSEEYIVIAVADCTGHGVPGAFMSMLGISFLNEIVQKHEIRSTDQILNELRSYIISSFKHESLLKKAISGEPVHHIARDGMDISLAMYHPKSMTLQFSGARNPLYLIRREAIKNVPDNVKTKRVEPYNLYEFPADKMPIALFYKMNPFTKTELKLKKGDLLYLFTDGFVDQFSDKHKGKFNRNGLKQLFLENAHFQLDEQSEKIENAFADWKGNSPQIDDVCIIGLCI